MTEELQRIAIAESVGIYLHDGDHAPSNYMFVEDLPDYLNDLNAMHAAEKVLNDEQQWEWVTQILRTLPKEPHFKALVFRIGTATAAQRAEAFLRSIGKWEDV